MNKSKEALQKQKRQKTLKREVKKIKKKLPSLIIGFLFFVAISFYFLETTFYQFFRNNVGLIIVIAIIFFLLFLYFVVISCIRVRKKQKEAKIIGSELYKLMKLEIENKNE